MVNREFLHAEGYDREELTGNTPFVEYLYRDDTGVFEDAIEVCRELRTTEEIELRIRTKSGGVCWELMRCRLYYYRDAVPYYILEHRQAEESGGRTAPDGGAVQHVRRGHR